MEEDYSGPRTIRSACDWLVDNRESESFFLQVECFDPHEPFDCPQSYLDLYGDSYEGPRYDWPKYGPVEGGEEAKAHIRNRYAATLTMIDHWFGKLLDTLDQLSMWEDTMLIFTTDHGYLLGEHELMAKNYMHVYNEVAHIPLMIHLPGSVHAGHRVQALTQNIDLMPTILERHGLRAPDSVRGHSLLGILAGRQDKVREYCLYGYHGMAVNLTDGRFTYFRSPAHSDNAPCYTYTAMPTTFRGFHGTTRREAIECGRYLKHTDYPVYRFPLSTKGQEDTKIGYIKESRLYDIVNDYDKLHPLCNSELEALYAVRLKEAMLASDCPDEQLERLGLQDLPI